MTNNAQSAILVDHPAKTAHDALDKLAAIAEDEKITTGISLSLVQHLGKEIQGLPSHPRPPHAA